MANAMPFTWAKLENMHGPVGQPVIRRLKAAINAPTRETWSRARTAIVAANLSEMGMTLWQAVEAATLTRYPDGKVPTSEVIVQALCYATGEPYRGGRR